MLRNRVIEAATTKYLTVSVLSVLVLTVAVFALFLSFKITELDKLSKFVDAIFKTMAILFGTIWTLNRYYVGRTDTTRLRVDSDVSTIRYPGSDVGLLIFRLDVVNTGKVLIPEYQQSLQIESVTPSEAGATYHSLHRWPVSGSHSGGPIEPDSWSAINSAIVIPINVRAVRIYLEIGTSEGVPWTWHKTFGVFEENGDQTN